MSNELTFVYNYYGNNKKYESHRNNSCNYANNLPKMKKKITSVAELKKKHEGLSKYIWVTKNSVYKLTVMYLSCSKKMYWNSTIYMYNLMYLWLFVNIWSYAESDSYVVVRFVDAVAAVATLFVLLVVVVEYVVLLRETSL